MPVWPFLMACAGALTVWGFFRNAWEAPFVMLCAYVATRFVVFLTPQQFVEVAICALWLCAAWFIVYRGHATPGLLLTLSALTYPVFLVFGVRLEYMSLVPIVADGFAVCAMIAIGGGLYGNVYHSGHDRARDMGRPVAYPKSMAQGRQSVGAHRQVRRLDGHE